MIRSKGFLLLVYTCFFFSGTAGLVYEVVWARQLGLFLGITGFAHTVVITAYMTGLAAGSLFYGRKADQVQQPLKLYAYLEIGVALYAALTPWLFSALQSFYASVAGTTGVVGMPGHMARLMIGLAALLIPTFLMGGTLPLLVRGVLSGLPELGRVTSRLYGLNTLGAMTGTLLAGFVLIEKIGMSATIFVGVFINLAIAALVLRALRGTANHGPIREHKSSVAGPADTVPSVPASDSPDRALRISILAGFGAAGFAALLTQLAWIRAMILLVGGSVYAFTIALASFLAGIAIGSFAYRWFFSRTESSRPMERLHQAGIVAGVIGFAILAGVPLLAMLPEWFIAAYAAGLKNNFALFQLFIFGLAFALMILPTLFMGVLFPLITVIWTSHFSGAGRGVGTAYAVNTAGTILGALLGGLFILPWLGIQQSLLLSAAIYMLVAALFWYYGSQGFSPKIRAAIPLVSMIFFIILAWYVPPWQKAVWGNGVYYRPDNNVELLAEKSLHEIMSEAQLLYYEEGIDGTVVVRDDQVQKVLVINGKIDASSKNDMPTQLMLGHLPALLHENPRETLIIGLGSGITAGAVAAYDNIQDITILEMLPEVVEASGFFSEENRQVLTDPRVNLVNADARNYVLSTDQTWDIIISEPSNPWISGVSNLFTDDFFKLIKQRLAPQGIMAQWFHAYNMSVGDLKSVLHTFSQSFTYVMAFNVQLGDLILLGSDSPIHFDLQRFGRAQNDPVVGLDLDRSGIKTARELMRLQLIGGAQLTSFVRGAKLNTDDRPVIEFNAPRNMYTETTFENLD